MPHDWTMCSDLSKLQRSISGVALLVVGIEGCVPCDVARRQAVSFVSENDGTSLDLYKFAPDGLHSDEAHIFGEEVRYFPTVIGLVDGEIAFRIKGMIRDADPEDSTRIAKAFARFAGRHG